ncbi:M48 family metallopeptidase [Bartonella krasnovii]|uniref:M48 family metallopeptidase n=1 Tax=Bartonella krasnovii TaxID=2267275 RepID=A0A5B9D3V9_9HYPH|nr:SprT family zinc-dependent metalloprotease [Bartonella krasnovii]QEE13039.1 M48 family metallopeptidase [Bartonella krasnovii]UNF29157.1 M48 family metallopeptidase [Bartonella krasnovii]UNF35514.1 M48 family metallopeptidase [Bartonella krasnovii]UNF37129.1 M48 family metallopeptidase [Bartonella krasnovii]UNF38829.1 M48 family metallopeptidase [Bartonella krasnovii]
MSISEKHFIFSDHVIPIRVRENKHARRFTLRIDARSLEVCVTTPPAIDLYAIESFIEKHRSWIETRLTRIQISHENTYLKEGATIPFLGVSHTIKHEKGRGVTKIVTADAEQGPKIIVYGQLEYLPRRIADVLKKQAALIITPLVTHYAHQVERKVKSICYKDTRSRWGSCSIDKRLSFSWRLIMAPKEVVEYVVAHEVAHLVEMNHGPRFWALCEKLCPDSKTHRAWLKENAHRLHAINFDSYKLEA